MQMIVVILVAFVREIVLSRATLQVENIALRQQVAVLKRENHGRRFVCSMVSVADSRQTKPNAVSGKHLASFTVKKRDAAGGEESVGGPDEIKK